MHTTPSCTRARTQTRVHPPVHTTYTHRCTYTYICTLSLTAIFVCVPCLLSPVLSCPVLSCPGVIMAVFGNDSLYIPERSVNIPRFDITGRKLSVCKCLMHSTTNSPLHSFTLTLSLTLHSQSHSHSLTHYSRTHPSLTVHSQQ